MKYASTDVATWSKAKRFWYAELKLTHYEFCNFLDVKPEEVYWSANTNKVMLPERALQKVEILNSPHAHTLYKAWWIKHRLNIPRRQSK